MKLIFEKSFGTVRTFSETMTNQSDYELAVTGHWPAWFGTCSRSFAGRSLSLSVTATKHHSNNHKLNIDTHIFMVPLGPRLLLSTSWSPLAAPMFSARAAAALATSAFGLRALIADMLPVFSVVRDVSFTGRACVVWGYVVRRKIIINLHQ